MAIGLISTFVRAVSGGSLYRKSTFLLDSLNKAVFPEHINLLEDPHLIGAMGSAPFDDEGVRTVRRKVVDEGVVQGYFLSSYSARRLGMQTTGNAGGSHNLIFSSTTTGNEDDYGAMLRKMNTGLVVTELLGQGINVVTGDYSRGASGYWVENGVIQYPVQEITIAGNLKDMFAHIVAVGADTLIRGGKQTGSIQTASVIANPGTLRFFVSKESTNTNASSVWKVSVKTASASSWTQVGNDQAAAAGLTRGTWYEVSLAYPYA